MPTISKLLLSLINFYTFSIEEGGGGGETPPANNKTETFSREYVQELRHENAGYRTKATENARLATEAEERIKTAETAAQAKIDEANKTADQRIIRAELKAAAVKAGMVDLDGLKLADLTKIKLDANGEVEGADALMEEMKKAKPYLFQATNNSSNIGDAPPKPADTKPKGAKEMTDAEYKAERAKIKQGIVPKVTV